MTSMLCAALAAACLCVVSDAARTMLQKERSATFLSAGVSAELQQTSQMSRKELGMLQETERQMSSDIDKVQKVLEVALLELGNWVQKEPVNNTSTHSKASSKEETAGAKWTKIFANSTHSKQANPATPKQKAVLAKEQTIKKVNASFTNSSQVVSKDKASKNNDSVKPLMNKSSNLVALSGHKAKVQQVAKNQEAILETLFKHLKSNIVNLNKQESSAKEVAAKNVARLKARLQKDQAELQKKGLSSFEHERLVNKTRTDTFELQYWTRDRSLGHSMFHTNLKMQHTLMSRVHDVIAVCKEAASKGHVDPGLMKKLQSQALPKAFIQMRSTLNHKAQQYYAHVLTARWMVAEEPEPE